MTKQDKAAARVAAQALKADLLCTVGPPGSIMLPQWASDQRAVEILTQLLDEESAALRLQAVLALGLVHAKPHEAAVPVLVRALEDKDAEIAASPTPRPSS